MLKEFDPRKEFKEFTQWWFDMASNISKVSDALNERLNTTDQHILEEQMVKAEQVFDIATGLYAYAEAYLDYAEFCQIGKVEKDPKMSGVKLNADEKKYWVANAVKNERLFRNLMEGIIKKIDNRIKACQTILSSMRAGR